jgi:hypothetical protein
MTNIEHGHQGPGMVAPVASADAAKAPTKAKAPMRRNPRVSRLLGTLGTYPGREVSTVELRRVVGCANVSSLVGRVNKAHGHIIKTVERKVEDRDGRSIVLGFYVIEPGPCAALADAAMRFHEGWN